MCVYIFTALVHAINLSVRALGKSILCPSSQALGHATVDGLDTHCSTRYYKDSSSEKRERPIKQI